MKNSENRERINHNLEALAKQLYDYWFVQFDFPNEEGKPYKSSGGKMIWNEKLKREIPEGWEVVKIQDIAQTYSGIDRYVFFMTSCEILSRAEPLLNIIKYSYRDDK